VAAGTTSIGGVTGSGTVAVSNAVFKVGHLQVTNLSVGPSATAHVNSGVAGVSEISNLVVEPTGLLDIGAGGLVVHHADLAVLAAAVAAWYSGGARTGGGIGSSAAAAANSTTVAIVANTAVPGVAYFSNYGGISLTPTDLLLRYTYVGDLNLDGLLDGKDLARVLEGYSTGMTGWANGDVDYSGGPVTAADVQLVMSTLSAGLPPLGGGPNGSDGREGSVPEGSIAWMGLGVPLLLRRTR
jgi:hypothetical protein